MKKSWKRSAALILAVCLLLCVVPPRAARAAASVTTYDLNLAANGLVNAGLSLEKAMTVIEGRYSTAGWKWEATNITTENTIRFYAAGLTSIGAESDWMAIRIKAPGTSGVYTLGLDYATHPDSGKMAVYVLPGDTEDVEAAMDLDSRVGKLDQWEADPNGNREFKSGYQAYLGTCELTADQEYIVVFEGYEASPYHATRAYMTIDKLTLTQGDVTQQAQKTQLASPVVADPGPVTLLEGCYYGTTMQIDGSDYLFEPVEGGMLLAFDLDHWERRYEEELPFLTTRGIAADDSGNLWLCGDNSTLYRFDPKTRIGEQIKSFATVDAGATSGFDMVYADGCLYFGAYPNGSVVKYDIEADTYTRLYTNGGSYANGLVYKDGYLYATIYDIRDSANESWKVIRIDLANTENVVEVDISDKMSAGQLLYDAALAGDLLLVSGGLSQQKMIAIDITTMEQVDLGLTGGISYCITEEVDGKVYFVLNNGPKGTGLYAFDVQERTLSSRLINTTRQLHCSGRSIVQVDDENYPGNNIAVYATATGEPMLYNLTKRRIKSGTELIENYGTATYIRTITNDPDSDLYIGGFNTENCAIYNTTTATVTKFETEGQTDALCWYDGELYAGNYPDGAIVRVDLENSANNETLLKLNDAVYDQARIHTLTAGEGKIFAGTTPDKGLYGGCLAWVDLATGESYVHKNVVQDQTVNCIVYRDGLIYGTTSIYGGTGTTKPADLSAKLFVYDVAAKQVLGTFDLREYISGLSGNIEYISGIAADPNGDGRFWGLVCETLFSFAYNKDTNELTVTEELSYSKTSYATGGGRTWFPKPFCFDGEGNLYLAFGEKGGMRRINTENTADNTRLMLPEPLYYALGADGNLYYAINAELYMYPLSISEAQWNAAAAVDQLIQDIGEQITLESAAAIQAARLAYDTLELGQQALVQNLDLLEEAEAQLLDLEIALLPNVTAKEYRAQVLQLYSRYEAMTDRQQGYVKKSPALLRAYSDSSYRHFMVAGTLYKEIGSAIEAAAAQPEGSKLVELIDDATVEDVLLTGGVTLDLCGKVLTADAVTADLDVLEADGFVVDSSAGNTGLLAVESGSIALKKNNPDIALYDTAAAGYRFFDYALELHETADKLDVDSRKFWFKFQFRADDEGTQLDLDAYDLVAAGGSDFKIRAELAWNGENIQTVYFGRNYEGLETFEQRTDAFSKEWADGAVASRWLYVIVRGLAKTDLGTLTVEPVLTANGVELTSGAITYVKNVDGSGGWSDEGPAGLQ